MKEFAIVFSILSLLAVGLMITLKSGSVSLSHGNGVKVVAGNFSAMVWQLLACFAFLIAVQYVIGYPLTLGF